MGVVPFLPECLFYLGEDILLDLPRSLFDLGDVMF